MLGGPLARVLQGGSTLRSRDLRPVSTRRPSLRDYRCPGSHRQAPGKCPEQTSWVLVPESRLCLPRREAVDEGRLTQQLAGGLGEAESGDPLSQAVAE